MKKPASLIIIKKHNAEHEHKSHGVWKIAYADFMTALMAFFLMMWLTSSVSENIRQGLSNYFAPIGASTNTLGTDSVLDGGKSLDELGSLNNMALEESIFPQTPEYKGANKFESSSEGQKEIKDQKEKDAVFEHIKKEEVVFEEVQKTLKNIFTQNKDLKQYEDQVIANITSEGLNIELIDKAGKNMFVVGGKDVLSHTKVLLAQISKVINILPNKVKITGHTDARPYGANASYNNWDLSTDRALVSRRLLVQYGLAENKIMAVVGKASMELLNEKDPFAPANRRISIVVLRNAPISGEQK
jgi:chemotaxis protein MotB